MNKTRNHTYGALNSAVSKVMKALFPLQPYRLEADKDQEGTFALHIEGNYFYSKRDGSSDKLDEALVSIEKKFKQKRRKSIFLYKRWSNYVKLYEPAT